MTKIAFANFLANLVFYFVAYIACGRRYVVASFRLFQNAVAGSNLKAVCDSVNNKVPFSICLEVSYPGRLVQWGCDCPWVLEVTLWALLDVLAVGAIWHQANMLISAVWPVEVNIGGKLGLWVTFEVGVLGVGEISVKAGVCKERRLTRNLV